MLVSNREFRYDMTWPYTIHLSFIVAALCGPVLWGSKEPLHLSVIEMQNVVKRNALRDYSRSLLCILLLLYYDIKFLRFLRVLITTTCSISSMLLFQMC